MINAGKIMVGDKPVDVLDGTGTSQVKVYEIRNMGTTPLYVIGDDVDAKFDPDRAYEIAPNQAMPSIETMGPEKIFVRRADDKPEEPVRVLLRHG